ncbi:hypothetical protein Btru_008857 [Bulinus truncatus]|nr:hypothetical protein Btru_008857 [Bulinus truncatus]
MASQLHIPFRCPTCGDSRRFETLHELRSHLENEHSYASSRYSHRVATSTPDMRIKPRTGRQSPLMEMFNTDAQKLEESLKKCKEEEMNNKIRRSEFLSGSQLPNESVGNLSIHDKIQNVSTHSSFRDYGHSSRLQKYYSPSKHVRDNSSKGKINTVNIIPFQHYVSDISLADETSDVNGLMTDVQNRDKLNSVSFLKNTSSQSQVLSRNTSEKHIQDTLSALSHEVLVERASQHATADSLYAAQELLSSVEQAAEIKIAQQKKVIEILAEKLKEKESKLSVVMHQIEFLSHQQVDSLGKVSALKQQSDMKAEHLQKQLDQKQRDFDALNQKLFVIHQSLLKGSSQAGKKEDDTLSNLNITSDSPQASASFNLIPKNENVNLQPSDSVSFSKSVTKDKEIKRVKNKAQQLERDRQNLLIEMQNLLESAATDNEKLQSELVSQSQELSQLSMDLEQSKQEQAELLGETSALYHQADVSLAKLKLMLKDREQELINVSKSLEQAKAVQVKLAREKDEYLRLAEDREAKYLQIMTANSEQVKSMKKTLDFNLHEKKKLEEKLKELQQLLDAKNGKDTALSENVAYLKSALEDKMKSQTKMKEELVKREEKLKKAKREMERMTKFLKDTAEKELEARAKLEDFISGLIDRAGKAEAELQKLKESYRLQQHKGASKKHKKESTGILDLSQLPGASSVIHQPSSDFDSESLASSQISSYPDSVQIQYHSTPKTGKLQQPDSQTSVKRYTLQNTEMPQSHRTNKSMRLVEEVSHDESHFAGDGNFTNSPDAPLSMQNHGHRTYLDLDGNNIIDNKIDDIQYNQPESGALQAEKETILLSSNLENSSESCSVTHLHLCPACSQSLHAPQPVASPLNSLQSFPCRSPTLCRPSITAQNASLAHQKPVSPESKSLHVVSTDIALTKSMPNLDSLAPLQHPSDAIKLLVNPADNYPQLLNNLRSPSLAYEPNSVYNTKEITNTGLYDKLLISPGTAFTDLAPIYYNNAPQFYNSIPSNPYNLSTDWSKQPAPSLPEYPHRDNDYDESLYSSYLKTKESTLFKNLPEVEKMFANVFKHSPHSLISDAPPLTEMIHGSSSQGRRQKLLSSEEKPSQRLSIDENGIMWESHSPKLSKNNRKRYSQKQFKNSDDTDIDEDFSDYIYETDPTSQAKLDTTEYFPIRKKSPHSMTKPPLPLGEKIAKILTSADSKKYSSSARDSYNNYLSPEMSKVLPQFSNEYSSEDSTESSPLHKAKMVQKRLEHLTSPKSKKVLNTKQSDGFDVSEMDSDFSTSSYLSLCKPVNNVLSIPYKDIQQISPSDNAHINDADTKLKEPVKVAQLEHPVPDLRQENVVSDLVNKKDTNKKIDVPVNEDIIEKDIRILKPSLSAVCEEPLDHADAKAVQCSSEVQNKAVPIMPSKSKEDQQNQNIAVQVDEKCQGHQTSATRISSSPSRIEQHIPSQNMSELDKVHQQDLNNENVTEPIADVAMLSDENEVLSSSDEDYTRLENEGKHAVTRKESIDASTDTDLEKLAKPGYVQKGLVIRKNIPTVKHIRKKTRRRPVVKRAPSEESSEVDDLNDAEREKRHSQRRLRVALFRIFSYLDTPTLLEVSFVSKEWCRVSRHPALWKVVKLESRSISSRFLMTLSQWCSQTRSLKLQGLTGRPINENESAEEYNASVRGSLEIGLEKFLSSCQNTITQLSIDNCENILTDKCLWLVSGYCRLLTKLTYRSSMDCVTAQLMWALGGGCPGITSLFVQPKPPL